MPNLKQLFALREKYQSKEQADPEIRQFIEKGEARESLIKAFDSGFINESRAKVFAFIKENLNPEKPEIVKYFDEGKSEDVALLFIDIASFSKTIQGCSNTAIKEYLDKYYETIIPIIYNFGGEIEKLMGDGIICVFGKPFLNLRGLGYVYRAEECAETIIKVLHGTNMNVKVAIHKGEITYYKVPGEDYGEYTMIGQPITELYRLESVSKANAINFYAKSSYDQLGFKRSYFSPDEVISNCFPINDLQGVTFDDVRYITFPGYY